MKHFFFFGIFLLMIFKANAQINLEDSTVQVIGYWDNGEKQTYLVTQEKYKIKDSDTTAREFWKYAVDVTIVDSTADSYTVDWSYRDYEIQTDSEMIRKLTSIIEDITVTIKTDEFGMFMEVVNWEEVRDYIHKGTKLLKKETKDIPNLKQVISQLESLYSSRESIEAAAIKDIQQFYTFHGAAYKLGEEYSADVKVPNLYGGEPFDTEVVAWLDEINAQDSDYLIRMYQSVDSEQLTKVTFDYLTTMAETMKVTPPKWEDFPSLTNETWTASWIHNSGWIIYSIETKEVTTEGQTAVEERIIEIQ